MRQGNTVLRVNDQVEVITGKDKGRVGKILKIDKGQLSHLVLLLIFYDRIFNTNF